MEEVPMVSWLYRNLNEKIEEFIVSEPSRNNFMDYTIATLNFYRDTGALQVLPDGMWKL